MTALLVYLAKVLVATAVIYVVVSALIRWYTDRAP